MGSFFEGGPEAENGTEEIITSWRRPVGRCRTPASAPSPICWKSLPASSEGQSLATMPWLVVLFGFMIVPLASSPSPSSSSSRSCSHLVPLCLLAAAAMLIQISLFASTNCCHRQFLRRRQKAGAPVLRGLPGGRHRRRRTRADEGIPSNGRSVRSYATWCGGVDLPWNLAGCLLIGVWLMFTRIALGTEGAMADADHLIGSLVITVTAVALAVPARPVRFFNATFASPCSGRRSCTRPAVRRSCPWSLRRGPRRLSCAEAPYAHYGNWNRFII
jgi:hypothetical protein